MIIRTLYISTTHYHKQTTITMNNDQNKGVTGVAKTGTGILGNTVSGVSNTLGGVVGMTFFFFPSIDFSNSASFFFFVFPGR